MSISEFIIKQSFNFSVWLISHICNTTICEQQLEALRNMEPGTLGRDIADCLDANCIKLIPGFQSHDLKHVLLDFKMTPLDEIRMQAFMLGNGNYSFACFAILLFGALLLPSKWKVLYQDFLLGRVTIPVSDYTIDEYADRVTLFLRRKIVSKQKRTKLSMNLLTKSMAFLSIAAGFLGMCYCLPFLFSSNLADILGAGFPFIGGTILIMAGMLTLSNLVRVKSYQKAPMPIVEG